MTLIAHCVREPVEVANHNRLIRRVIFHAAVAIRSRINRFTQSANTTDWMPYNCHIIIPQPRTRIWFTNFLTHPSEGSPDLDVTSILIFLKYLIDLSNTEFRHASPVHSRRVSEFWRYVFTGIFRQAISRYTFFQVFLNGWYQGTHFENYKFVHLFEKLPVMILNFFNWNCNGT